MKTFQDLKSYQNLLAVKQQEERQQQKINQANSHAKDLNKKLVELSENYEKTLKDPQKTFADANAIQQEMEIIQADLKKAVEAATLEEKKLPAILEEVQKAEAAFVKEAIPIVDKGLLAMDKKANELVEINQFLVELIVEADTVKRKTNGNSSFLTEPLINDIPGIRSFYVKNLPGIVNYQKEQWQKFKQSVK